MHPPRRDFANTLGLSKTEPPAYKTITQLTRNLIQSLAICNLQMKDLG